MSATADAPAAEGTAPVSTGVAIVPPKKGRLMHVPLSKVRSAELAIRKDVDKESEKYRNLRDSVKNHGIMNPPNAREEVDPMSPAEKIYVLIDGLQRTTAARDLGLPEIPLHVLEVTPIRAMEMQFVANLQRIEMTPVEFTKALVEYLALNPTVTKLDVANGLSKSEAWVEERLSLQKLDPNLAKLVDEGTIKLANALNLAKLPVERQADFKDAAIGKSSVEFLDMIRAERSAIAKAKRDGSKDVVPVYEPRAKFKQMAQLIQEVESPNELASFVSQHIVSAGVTDPVKAAVLAVQWCINLDPISLAAGQKKFDDDQAKKAADAATRAAERQAKKEAKENAAPAGASATTKATAA